MRTAIILCCLTACADTLFQRSARRRDEGRSRATVARVALAIVETIYAGRVTRSIAVDGFKMGSPSAAP